jgi:4-hydroxy-3-methylbut-2-enyl diphosphate reductase LytB-like protein
MGASPPFGPRKGILTADWPHEGHLGAAARILCRRGPAIEIVERALDRYGAPVYARHEIVHNRHVVESLKAKGARFVEDLSAARRGDDFQQPWGIACCREGCRAGPIGGELV